MAGNALKYGDSRYIKRLREELFYILKIQNTTKYYIFLRGVLLSFPDDGISGKTKR